LPVNISNTPGVNSENPSLAVSGANTYVVWQDTNDILFFRDLPVPDPAPKITNIDPGLGPVNATVTLTGLNFGATQGLGSNVFVGSTLAQVVSWSDTQIQVTIPSLSAGSHRVILAKGAEFSNALLFQVISPLSISGTVEVNGVPTSGVTVSLSGTASKSTTTVASGTYAFTNLAPGTYTVKPSRSFTYFDPSTRTAGLVAKSLVGLNFAGSIMTSISLAGSLSRSCSTTHLLRVH
jgi:hypothetical protein